MGAIRCRVRTVACAWLICQVASLSAFVPGECCKTHAAVAAAKAKAAACHESSDVAPTEGDACPMHHGQQSHACCTISNGCDGPGQQLTTLFAYIGFLESPRSASIVLESTAALISPAPALLYHLAIPDAPPPKLNLA